MNAFYRSLYRRRIAVALTAVCCVMAASTGAALAQDDDDVPFEQQLLNKLLGRDKPAIDYRERSPLVIPPSKIGGAHV